MSTILALFVLAAETAHGAEHEETSKTLFYALGGAAAAFGVAIGTIGVVKHDFPATDGAARVVYALATLFVLGAMASSVLTG